MSWNETDTRNALRWWIDVFGRMPTNTELVSLGASTLARHISNTLGFEAWADAMGCGSLPSETLMGKRWERHVCDVLAARGYVAELQREIKAPFDILVDGALRVNVKSAHFNTYTMKSGGKCSGYFFGIGDTHKRCDAFALVCDDDSDEPRILWAPSSEVRQQTVTLTKRHRLNAFTDMSILGGRQ